MKIWMWLALWVLFAINTFAEQKTWPPMPPKTRCECIAVPVPATGDSYVGESWCYALSYAKEIAIDACHLDHEACKITKCERIAER